jgi:SAM-dependent methyltransferase
MSESFYARSAEFYDLVYAGKPYADEAATVHARIQAHLRSDGNALLDVGCGTGNHLAHLREHYQCDGLDLEDGLLQIARDRYPDATFHPGDMVDFDLGRTFDAIVCLFSAIGYVYTEARLRQTIASFARHLRPGGVAVVEPWLSPENFRPGRPPWLDVSESDSLKVARMGRTARDGDASVIEFVYVLGHDGGIEHWEERHPLGLFTHEQTMDAFRTAGLEVVEHDPQGLTGRGLYVARRPESAPPG